MRYLGAIECGRRSASGRAVRELSAGCPRDPHISTDLNESQEMTGRVGRTSKAPAAYAFLLRGKGSRSVGATGIEPVTSAVSRQRSAAELSARIRCYGWLSGIAMTSAPSPVPVFCPRQPASVSGTVANIASI